MTAKNVIKCIHFIRIYAESVMEKKRLHTRHEEIIKIGVFEILYFTGLIRVKDTNATLNCKPTSTTAIVV